jgi:hypothetical protein
MKAAVEHLKQDLPSVNGAPAACWVYRFPHIAIARHDVIASCARS